MLKFCNTKMGASMSYIIRDNQLQTAKPIKNLTDDQKKVLRVGTRKQIDKIKSLKAQLAS
jgi:hypothetical protein